MTIARFTYQADAARAALAEIQDKPVLNVGANEDPGAIKSIDPSRIVNCDLFEFDEVESRPNNVDVLFDCAQDKWPFEDKSCSLVIMGDIIEHLSLDDRIAAFKEANRVADRIVVTCPHDPRPETFEDRSAQFPRGAVHIVLVGKDDLEKSLEDTGWNITNWQDVDYGFVPEGYFVTAEAK